MIHIEKDWYITADEYCYILFKKTGKARKDSGESERTGHRYYQTITDAIKGYLSLRMKEVSAGLDCELCEALRALTDEVKRIEQLIDIEKLEERQKGADTDQE